MNLQGSDISVLIPAFNAEHFIDEAIQSVVNQTVRPGEIIVVDDGSIDATAVRCSAWAPDVALIRQSNAGPGRARNVAAHAATGAGFALLDADDTWLPHKLEVQLAYLADHPDHVAVFGWMQNFVDPHSHLVVGPKAQLDARPAHQPSTMLARRAVVDAIGPFDEVGPLQGWLDWFMRLRESGLSIGMVDQLVTMRRIHDDNLSIREQAHKSELHRFLHASLQRRRERGPA